MLQNSHIPSLTGRGWDVKRTFSTNMLSLRDREPIRYMLFVLRA
jgi:hypothetical protein